jgi:maltose alpha-D-glucosyltransferase / alpha-amylase
MIHRAKKLLTLCYISRRRRKMEGEGCKAEYCAWKESVKWKSLCQKIHSSQLEAIARSSDSPEEAGIKHEALPVNLHVKKSVVVVIALIVFGAIVWMLVKNRRPVSRPDNSTTMQQSVYAERKKSGLRQTNDLASDLWYKSGIIYTLDVETFKDSDNDGIGDFKGLIQKLDYIESLGVTILWLAPFYPTSNKDDGYDITDYYSIDPRLGTMEDYQQLVTAATSRGIRVIADLVFNHTSSAHPWFVRAKDPSSPFHSWYVWSKKEPFNRHKGMVFEGIQEEIWTYDSTAKEYYYHRFYGFEPDLNMQNKEVRQELEKVMRFWLNTGIAGFRVDAVRYMTEIPQTSGNKFDHQYEMLIDMRNIVRTVRADGILLGEADVPAGENDHFFGKNGEALNMIFNFYINQRLFYAMATTEVKTLADALKPAREIPVQGQWVYYLRNQDEMGMGRFNEKEQEKVYKAFGPDKYMQLYKRGVRRRLAPMMNNDRRRIEMAYSLMLSMPGTPMIRYGEEIGMGDDLSLKERMGVRTPMQWDDSRNAGFSNGPQIIRPVIDSGVFDYRHINVASEEKDSTSLLNTLKRMITTRENNRAVSWGNFVITETGSPHVLGIRYDWEGKSILTIHNCSPDPQTINLKLEGSNALHQFLPGRMVVTGRNSDFIINMQGYGYSWFNIQ